MSPEKEPKQNFEIQPMQIDDIEVAAKKRFELWSDTYINEEYGITQDWIESYNAKRASPEAAALRLSRFLDNKNQAAWMAKGLSGEIIGSALVYIGEDGAQNLGALYVDKEWQGKDVANELMKCLIGWFDQSKPIELGVAVYNERAKAFYRKWDFEEVPGSEYFFADKIPSIVMIRKGEIQDAL